MSASDNNFVNKTTVTTATSASKLWLNIDGSIRQLTIANFFTAFASLVTAAAKRYKIRTITSAEAATSSDDIVLVNTTGGDVNFTLDTAANMYSSANGDTAKITVRQINHNSNSVFVYPSGGNTINGSASYELTNDSSASFISDGTNIRTIDT
jgi:hypothetical protein